MLFPCMFTIQRDDFQVSEKKDISWAVKLAGSWERITYISKGQRKNLQLQVYKRKCTKKWERGLSFLIFNFIQCNFCLDKLLNYYLIKSNLIPASENNAVCCVSFLNYIFIIFCFKILLKFPNLKISYLTLLCFSVFIF